MANQRLTVDCHSIIASEIQGLDYLARGLEQKWGVGRLRLLVDANLRLRFDQQIDLLNQALASDTSTREEILGQIAGCKRAWQAVEASALASGCQPTPPAVWEVLNDNGGLFMIVRDEADASMIQIQAKERRAQVYSLAEIGRLLDRYPEIAKVKDVFAGAVVTSVRPRTPTAEFLNDDLPF